MLQSACGGKLKYSRDLKGPLWKGCIGGRVFIGSMVRLEEEILG